MSDYPDVIYPGVTIDCDGFLDDPDTGYVSNINTFSNQIVAIENKLGVNSSAVTTSIDYLLTNPASADPGHTHTLDSLDLATYSGEDLSATNVVIDETTYAELGSWIEYKDTSFLYGSASGKYFTMTGANANTTDRLQVGVKLKITQGTVKYFILQEITFGSPNTTHGLFGGTDYTLTADPITKVEYSYSKCPFGFNINPDKWALYSVPASATVSQVNPVSGTYYNLGGSMTIYKGVWNLGYSCNLTVNDNSYTNAQANILLRLAQVNNGTTLTDITPATFTGQTNITNAIFQIDQASSAQYSGWPVFKQQDGVTVAAEKTLYMNAALTGAGFADLSTLNPLIFAYNAYL